MDTPLVKAAFLFSKSFKETIPKDAFTHIYICIDVSNGYEEISSRSDQITAFARTVRESYNGVKLVLSIGGDFSIFIDNKFIDLVINLLKKLRFDGLDLRWLYPDTSEEMAQFGDLLAYARKLLPPPLLLTATVFYKPRYRAYSEYPILPIVTYCDWINVMAFDLYTPVSSPELTSPPAPLYNERNSIRSGDFGVTDWMDAGVPARKLVFGLPFYGRSWSLKYPDDNGPFSPADGPATEVSDPIPYRKILEFQAKYKAESMFMPSFVQVYCYAGKTWIGFDGQQSIPIKVRYAKNKEGLLGYFAWHVEDDDTDNWTLSRAASGAWDNNINE